MKYNAIIVDDVYAVDALKNLMHSIPSEINLCFTTNSIVEAQSAIQTLQPEILILNISLEGIFGLIFSSSYTIQKPIIIFTLNPGVSCRAALLANGIDFLVKPFGPDGIAMALPKAIGHFETIKLNPDAEGVYHQSLLNLRDQIENRCPLDKITIPVRFGYKIINLSELIYLHSDDKYTILYLTDSRILVANLQIDRFNQFLPGATFFMINTFTIINLKFLKIRSGAGGKILQMTDGTILSVSKSRLNDFEKMSGGH
jgi:two-component system, LytTR family, response regulator LytT